MKVTVIQSIRGHPNLISGWKILLPFLHFLRRWNYFHSLKCNSNIILLKVEQVLSPEPVSLALRGKKHFSAKWYAKNLASLGIVITQAQDTGEEGGRTTTAQAVMDNP